MKYVARTETIGVLIFVAGVIIFMGIITGETFYPEGYSTFSNEISDLGATRPPDSIITQPSATIFNTTMLVAGALLLYAMGSLRFRYQNWLVNVPYLLFALGVFGVGLFPGNITPWHPIFAMLTFVSGGVAAIVTTKLIVGPIKYVFAGLGIIALGALFFSNLLIPLLGMGGTERWVAYPILFWLVGLGAYVSAYKHRLKTS